MQYSPITRTSLLALLLATATSPAAAVVIGEPDNSYITHFVGVSEPTPDTHVEFQNYTSPTVSGAGVSKVPDNLDTVPWLYGGTNTWTFDVSLEQGVMRASVSGSSGLTCDPNECLPAPTAGQVLLKIGDRVHIDQEITAPTTATITLAVDGLMSGPSDGGVQVLSALRAFIDPFGDGLAFDEYSSQDFGPTDFLLQEDVLLNPGQQWFDIEATLHLMLTSSWLTSGAFTSMDFSHTALFNIVLPKGLTFLTEGGFTGQATTVPEPASLALFWAGLLGLAMLRCRHRPVVDQVKCWRAAQT